MLVEGGTVQVGHKRSAGEGRIAVGKETPAVEGMVFLAVVRTAQPAVEGRVNPAVGGKASLVAENRVSLVVAEDEANHAEVGTAVAHIQTEGSDMQILPGVGETV